MYVVSKGNPWLIQGSNMLISSAVYCTSRHNLPHILHREDREFLLRVHTDHAVAQPAHWQHSFPWRRNTHFWRPEGHGNHYNYSSYCSQRYPQLSETNTVSYSYLFSSKHTADRSGITGQTYLMNSCFFLNNKLNLSTYCSWTDTLHNMDMILEYNDPLGLWEIQTLDRLQYKTQIRHFFSVKIEPVCQLAACVFTLSVILILLYGWSAESCKILTVPSVLKKPSSPSSSHRIKVVQSRVAGCFCSNEVQ